MKIIKNTGKLLGISLVAILGFACTEKKEGGPTGSVDQSDMLTAYANEFKTRSANSLVSMQSLDARYGQFKSGEASLNDVQASLVQAIEDYNQASLLYFGPGDQNGESLNDRLHTFPVNQILITENINNGVVDVANQFRTAVGLSALEYILYNSNSIFENSEEGLKSGNGANYIQALLDDMIQRLQTLSDAYNGSYFNEFVANTGSADGSSLALFSNAFVMNFETNVRNNKLRIPIGKFNGGNPLFESAEAFYADQGLELAAKHFKSIKNLYILNNDSSSLSNYIVSLGEPELNETILEQLNSIDAAYDDLLSINGSSLTDAINNYNSEVSDLIDLHQMLIPTIKGNMLNNLGVRINYTDSDGD